MKIYVAGPMSGMENYNAPSFERAQDRLEGKGHEVVTPLDTNSRVWRRHFDRPFDPYRDECDYGHPLLREMFAENIQALTSADAIAVLDGWRDSRGSQVEVRIARLLGISVLHADTLEPVDETVLEEANRLIYGARNEDYGHPLDDFSRTAQIWSAILGTDVEAEDVALCMIGVKMSREVNHGKRDNRTDIAGYAGTLQMVRNERARRERDRHDDEKAVTESCGPLEGDE